MATLSGLHTTLSAPLPIARPFNLLDTVRLIENTEATERWEAGAYIEAYPGGITLPYDPCSEGSWAAKSVLGVFARPIANAFTVYLAAECTTQSIGEDEARFTERIRAAFRANEAIAVEKVLASGIPGTMNLYLGDTNMEILGGGAVSPVVALGLLEDEIASVGNGVIHLAPASATWMASQTLIGKASDGKMRTLGCGTLVVVGAGYRDADPASGATPSASQEWAFASGPIEVRRSEDFFVADRTSSVTRETNDETQIIERNYLLSWVGRQDGSDEDFIQAGVLITRPA